MTTKPWDTSPAREVGTVVHVNGVERPHTTVTWGQELASALPDMVTGGGGFAQRTGTIVWFRHGAHDTLPSPWNEDAHGWIPAVGDRVTVDAIDGQGHAIRVFTGRVDTVEGDESGGLVSQIVDRIDDFSKIIRLAALTSLGAVWQLGRPRRNAATGAWIIDEIARRCGYTSTPPRPPGHILDAPLQGTVYVYADGANNSNAQLLEATSEQADKSTNPRWKSGGGRGRLALGGAHLMYAPYSAGGTGTTSRFRMSVMIHPDHAAPVTLTTHVGGSGVVLRVGGNRQATVSTGAGWFSAFVLPDSDEPVIVSAIYRGGQITVASSTGQSATFSSPTPSGSITEIEVANDFGAAISGVQVSDPGTNGGHVATDFVPNFYQSYGWHAWWQEVAPSIRDRNAREVMDEFSAATLTPIWLDGGGNLNCVHTDHMVRQSHTVTVDLRSNARDLTWSLRLSDMRDPVYVDYSDPAVRINTRFPGRNVLVYQGGGGSAAAGSDNTEWINVPEDEEWIGLGGPETIRPLSDVFNIATNWIADDTKSTFGNIVNQTYFTEMSEGLGSYDGGSYDYDQMYKFDHKDPGTPQEIKTWKAEGVAFGRMNINWTQVTPWAWKRRVTNDGTQVNYRIPKDNNVIPATLQGENLPIIRGTGKVEYHDARYEKSYGRDDLLALTHNMGKWCTTSAIAKAFGDWLAAELKDPHPVVNGLVCRFDPRIEVGTVLQIDSTALHGVALKGLVIGVTHDPEADETTPTIRVITANTEVINSYAELANAWAGATYQDLAAAWATIGGTYDDLTTDPAWKG